MDKYEFISKTPKIVQLPFWVLVSSRPRQWLKNLALFAPLVFEGEFFNPAKFWTVAFGFVIFSIITSGVYLMNDVIDVKKDRAHPFKSKRPIAAGRLDRRLAILIASSMIIGAIIIANTFSSGFFTIAAISYSVLQIFYSLFLRSVILLDVMAIASGFLLRVYAGAVLINAHVTVWFILTVASLALFLAVGKRRSERTLLLGNGKDLGSRSILLHYPESLLDSLTVMFATTSWFSYTMFTFLQPPPQAGPQVLIMFGEIIPRTLMASKWLMATVPFVIYGVMRYLYVIHEKKEGESPERVLLSDKPLLLTVLAWIVFVFIIIYGSDFLPARMVRYLQ